MLSLRDLGYDPKDKESSLGADLREAVADIRKTIKSLGGQSVRDAVEAIYGEEYALLMLGEDGGKDVLVDELRATEDLREAMGEKRRDVGGNRLPPRKTGAELNGALAALDRRIVEVDAEADAVHTRYATEDGREFMKPMTKEAIQEMNAPYSEDPAEIARMLREGK